MNMSVPRSTGNLLARPQVRWRLCWENELALADHTELAEFFRRAYGPSGEFNAAPFEGSRSWAGARPELRIIAYDSNGVAGHAGILRRFIKVGETDLLVAELGLYAVRRDVEGHGVTYQGAVRFAYPLLHKLNAPFGFAAVRPAMRKHIERIGRNGMANILTGVRVRSTRRDVFLNVPPTLVEEALLVVLPIGRPMSEWPSGTLIDRNGPEL
ncbi:acyltransferase [Bradyrhizobium macuxiense]|uniref:Nodulation protein A n=1 Tax=Bradyrhizobium macuxiense TaxID=1755647 RepID=A0A109JTC0_9BRAD|nr:NodA family N-acyltransferase [Bradyrhizobium macuxiense]KWV54751.1 acyltransferase [Bradyrhizobium macuxiense]